MTLRTHTPVILLLLLGAAYGVCAQPTAFPDASSPSPSPRARRDAPRGVNEMLVKQRLERDRRDHLQMLERGEEALRLAKELENAFENNKTLGAADRQRLESLEKVVEKIREELGGDDDDTTDLNSLKESDDTRPSTVQEAFKYLQSTTIKLVDELKKTSRFTISAVAIQTSNNVLKLVKFLRLRK